MLKTDEDALVCDLAETYHIFNMKAVPVKTLARLACGLRDDSRIKMKLSGVNVRFETLIGVAILDELRWLHWSKTKDAEKGRNVPKSLLESLINNNDRKLTLFDSPEEFEKRRAEILEGVRND